MTRPNIPLLTASRFFAALFVVFFHYPNKYVIFPRWLTSFGNEAVVFFFILSGFILTYVHAQVKNGNLSLKLSNKQFIIARLSRIFPAYFIGLGLAAPIFIYGFLVSNVLDIKDFLLGISLVPVFLQSWWPPAALLWNAPAWSLSVEMFFYISFPVLFNVMRGICKWKLIISASFLVICVGALRYAYKDVADGLNWHNFISYFPIMHMPQFLFGISLGLLFIRLRQNLSFNRFLFYFGLLCSIILMTSKIENEWLSNPAIISFPFAALIYGAAGWPCELMRNTIGKYIQILGEASYSLYILHIPVLLWWQRADTFTSNLSPWTAFYVYFFLTVVLSISTFYLVEQPVRKWFINRLRKV